MMKQRVAATETRENAYAKAAEEAARHLIGSVSSTGYISASQKYAWYGPHWIRDSSWVAISLLRYSDFSRSAGTLSSPEALDAATRIIKFNIDTINNCLEGMERTTKMDFGNRDFFLLSNHIPARVGRNHKAYKDANMDDTGQRDTQHSWQMQHDSLPLVLISLKEKMDLFGLNDEEKNFLSNNCRLFSEYLGKVYLTECASAWESDSNKMHAYDIGAIHGAFEALEAFAANGIVPLTRKEIGNIYNGLYEGGPMKFVKDHFVKDDIIYGSRFPFSSSPDTSFGVDSATIFLFTDFGLGGGALGQSTERSSVAEMERKLFGGNILPVRFEGDRYFMGGRWLLLGLAFADYYAQNGEGGKAEMIIDYVVGKYKGSYPEQELVNPASPGIDDGSYYQKNGSTMIQELEWSYAALIIAVISQAKAEKGIHKGLARS